MSRAGQIRRWKAVSAVAAAAPEGGSLVMPVAEQNAVVGRSENSFLRFCERTAKFLAAGSSVVVRTAVGG